MKIVAAKVNHARYELYCFHLKKKRKKIAPARATIGPLEEQA
jgi:hypothetical protein